jgi:hypothetical protein
MSSCGWLTACDDHLNGSTSQKLERCLKFPGILRISTSDLRSVSNAVKCITRIREVGLEGRKPLPLYTMDSREYIGLTPSPLLSL